jgi:two-component system, NarL family, response regulator DesR
VIRILLVEQTGLWRRTLAAVLSAQDGLEVVAELANLDEAVSAAPLVRADLALIDVGPLTEMDGIADEIGKIAPSCVVLVIAEPAVPGAMRGLLSPDVRGLFGKDGGPGALVQCIRVAAGERVIDPTLAVAALCAPANPLTAREREVLRVAASGVPSGEIAARLHLSVGTVRNYLSMIIRKVGGRNRMEAIRLAEEAGWL